MKLRAGLVWVLLLSAVSPLQRLGAEAVATQPATGTAAKAVTAWSEPVDGVAVRLSTDRAACFVGEWLVFEAEARNVGGDALLMHTSGQLHMLTPSGEHLVHGPSAPNGARMLKPESHLTLRQCETRWLKTNQDWHRPGGQKQEQTTIDMTHAGVYTFWFTYHVEPGWANGGKLRVWSGTIESSRLKIDVRALKEAEKLRDLTPQQEDDLRRIADGEGKHGLDEVKAACKRVTEGLRLAREVGLAERATTLVGERRKAGTMTASLSQVLRALMMRAVSNPSTDHGPPYVVLDGAYVRRLAEQELAGLKLTFAGDKQGISNTPVLVALCVASKDEPLRKDVAALAVAHAKVPEIFRLTRAERSTPEARIEMSGLASRLRLAWSLLNMLDVLEGMSEEEVVKVLGEPTQRDAKVFSWHADALQFTQPRIRVTLENGKVTSTTSGRQ